MCFISPRSDRQQIHLSHIYQETAVCQVIPCLTYTLFTFYIREILKQPFSMDFPSSRLCSLAYENETNNIV